jgi:cytochrome c553
MIAFAAATAAQAESLAVRNCTWCHGGSARGYTPAPQLAGQRPQYLENQLAGFIRTPAIIRSRNSICGAPWRA